jgi:gentisate 1,2-dioxygenase
MMQAELNEAVDMASLPVQMPLAPKTEAAARARFFNSGNAFNIHLPDVPAASFDLPPSMSMSNSAPCETQWMDCDQSDALGSGVPATTPFMLARYLSLAAGAQIVLDSTTSGSIWYVIDGDGTATHGETGFEWHRGDVFMMPGSASANLHAAQSGALLWCVDNSPLQAHEDAVPRTASQRGLVAVHFPADEIERQLEMLFRTSANTETSGFAVIFSSAELEPTRNLLPTLTLSLNTVPPGCMQRPHRHNSAAITLVLTGDDCFSMVDGKRCDWRPYRTLVTPPAALHSHHNEGHGPRARFLIVQDGGLYYHGRTMGFAFADDSGNPEP